MSRLFFYIALSLALHFFAVLPLLQQPFSTAFAAATPTLERKALALPKLAVKPAGKPVASVITQAAKAPVAEQKTPTRTQSALKELPAKAVASAPEKPPLHVAKTEVQQQLPALQELKNSRAGETRRASEKPLVTERAQQTAQAELSVTKEVVSTQPRFARTPAAPVYPALARRRQQQGTVWVDVRLDAQGRQIGLQVLRSSGVKSLDQAALTAVKQWQFLPERQNGIGVPSRVHIPIEFAIAAKP